MSTMFTIISGITWFILVSRIDSISFDYNFFWRKNWWKLHGNAFNVASNSFRFWTIFIEFAVQISSRGPFSLVHRFSGFSFRLFSAFYRILVNLSGHRMTFMKIAFYTCDNNWPTFSVSRFISVSSHRSSCWKTPQTQFNSIQLDLIKESQN